MAVHASQPTQDLTTGRQTVVRSPEFRERSMPYYRLYCINSSGRFFHHEEFDADTDDQAIELADKLHGEDAAELWQEGRQVHLFKVGRLEQQE